MGGTGNDRGLKINYVSTNALYLAGTINVTADLKPGADTLLFHASGSDDIFI